MIWIVALLGAATGVLAYAVVRLRSDVNTLQKAVAVHEQDLTALNDERLIGGGR
jgi:hypothetical protein